MAHINNANSSSALALLQWGMTATVLQTTPVSILPSHQPLQTNAWNATLREQPESRTLNQDTALEVTLRSSHSIKTQMVSFPPKKAVPTTRALYSRCLYSMPRKSSCSATLFSLHSRRGKKSSFQKRLFKIYIQEKVLLQLLKS